MNHNGDIDKAKKLIDIAKLSGADIVKFQSFKADKLASIHAPKAGYQLKTTSKKQSQYNMLKKLELTEKMHHTLINYCQMVEIEFLSTGFDIESIKFLIQNGQKRIKIPSGEINNLPLLRVVGSLNKEIILSTGMSTIKEIEDALNILKKSGANDKNITVLHCNTDYPTNFKDVNLEAMIDIKEKLKVNVGYSDHTLGIEVPIAATAMGAKIIEKHFTIDRNLDGPDHKASLEPNELINMVKSIRNIEIALGEKIKKPSKSELKNLFIARKSIIAKREIKVGEQFSTDNITIKRPGDGLSPMLWDKVIGRISKFHFSKDEKIKI